MKKPSISYASVDECLWRIRRYLYRYGVDDATQEIAPLAWYVNTVRASTEFLWALVTAKPYMVGRRLHAGGSYDDVIARLKRLFKIS